MVIGLLTAALCLVLGACGGPTGDPVPMGAARVTGTLALPAGHTLDVASLEVTTPFGVYPLGPDGRFSAYVMKGTSSELAVSTPAGDLVALGVTEGADAQLSLQSTSEVLLYYLVGGMLLPADQQDVVRSLLSERPEVADIMAHLQRLLLAGGNGLAAPDQALRDAMLAAQAGIVGDPEVQAALQRQAVCPFAPWLLNAHGTELQPQAGEDSVIIQGGTDMQAGAMVLHNPAGRGVVVQNHLRRPAALLAYEVAWEDVDQIGHEVDPPVLVGTVDVPATGNLEFFAALGDIVTGDAPWAPVLSEPLVLSSHEGASLTQYELVLIGPSLTSDTLPIWQDSRFTSFHDDWDDIAFDKSVDLFLEDLFIPVVGVFAFGGVAKFTAGQLKAVRQGIKQVYDSHLLELGVYLKGGAEGGGYAAALKFALEELVTNKPLRLDTLRTLTDAFNLSEQRKFSIEAADARLAAHASAAAVAFAVETALVSGDLTKIVADLASAPAVASWEAEVMPARFLVDPPVGTVSLEMSSARFKVLAVGDPPVGNYRFRWSTSGTHGDLSDLMGVDGTVVDTTSPEIYYFHNTPNDIRAGDVDTILLEVFIVEDGVDAIPTDARPIGKGQAEVRGQGKEEMCVWECDDDGICSIHCP
ncbi:MAG: hypothetical protein KF875_13960 [Trueperaceae bacterium]|nr:hypothetical protein [Trueperaceae bacterium]